METVTALSGAYTIQHVLYQCDKYNAYRRPMRERAQMGDVIWPPAPATEPPREHMKSSIVMRPEAGGRMKVKTAMSWEDATAATVGKERLQSKLVNRQKM